MDQLILLKVRDYSLKACWKLEGRESAQRAKFLKKVHKPPFRANVVNFELNIAIQANVMESKGEVREAGFSLLQSQTLYILTFGNSALGT